MSKCDSYEQAIQEQREADQAGRDPEGAPQEQIVAGYADYSPASFPSEATRSGGGLGSVLLAAALVIGAILAAVFLALR